MTGFRRRAILVASCLGLAAALPAVSAAADPAESAPTARPTVGAEPSPSPEAGAALRDPFRPFNLALRPKPVETPKTPLEQYDVGALKLVAVIYDTQNPKAMVEDDSGLGYTVALGTKIGNQGGVVKTIDPDRVVVEEEFVDFYGEKKKTEIVLRLKPEGEKRP
ncbi:MAG: pilus assembly protein PilP [Deltaproteobacteria bacterium]|nr:pilus assembly protein PilP [Deltaproteobacteria bacterium]